MCAVGEFYVRGYPAPQPAHAPARGRRARFLGGANIEMSAVAVRNSRASRPGPPTSCTPMGSPLSPASNGSDKAGSPVNVHKVQKAGSPVALSPSGATPGAAGVMMASYWSKISARLAA